MNARVLIFGLTMLATSAYCTWVTATIKGTARLPCNAPQSVIMEHVKVYWQKQVSPTYEVVLETLNGQEVPEHQTKKYVNRARQDPSDLVLYLDQVKVTDEGTFECIVFTQKAGKPPDYKAEIQLKVNANFSFPELTQKPEGKVKNGTTVTLTCFSSEGYPAPQNVIWIVSSRNGITEFKGDVQKTQDNSTKLYNLTSIYTLNFTTNFNVSCTIHQTKPGGSVSSQTVSLDSEEDGVESGMHPGWIIFLAISVCAVVAAAIGFAVYRKRHSCCRAVYINPNAQPDADGNRGDIPLGNLH